MNDIRNKTQLWRFRLIGLDATNKEISHFASIDGTIEQGLSLTDSRKPFGVVYFAIEIRPFDYHGLPINERAEIIKKWEI